MVGDARDKDGDIISRLSTSDLIRSGRLPTGHSVTALAVGGARLSADAAEYRRTPPKTAERRPAGIERDAA